MYSNWSLLEFCFGGPISIHRDLTGDGYLLFLFCHIASKWWAQSNLLSFEHLSSRPPSLPATYICSLVMPTEDSPPSLNVQWNSKLALVSNFRLSFFPHSMCNSCCCKPYKTKNTILGSGFPPLSSWYWRALSSCHVSCC